MENIDNPLPASTQLQAELLRYQRMAAYLPLYIYAVQIVEDQIIPEIYSPTVERITGYAASEFIRDPWFWLKLVHPEDRDRIDEAIAKNFSNEQEAMEYRLIRKDGAVRWVRDQLRVSFDPQGKPNGYYGTVEDITERKVMEAALAHSEERYRILVENVDDIIYQHDATGNFITINAAGERFLGTSREQLVGRSWLELADFFEMQVDPPTHVLWQELQTGAPQICRVNFPTLANRPQTFYEFKIAPIYEQGTLQGFCGVGRDITQQEKQRQELVQAYAQLAAMQQKIISSERLLAAAQLASTLMHEINNPLSVIIGYAQMLPKTQDLPLSAEQQLKMIEDAAMRINKIMTQLDTLEDRIIEFGGIKIFDLHHSEKASENIASDDCDDLTETS
jgi:PAS domain S-box-containing protein